MKNSRRWGRFSFRSVTQSRVVRKLLIVLIVLLVIGAGLFTAYKLFLDPRAGSVEDIELTPPLETVLTRDEALADLSYMVDRVSDIHPLTIDGLPPAFAAAYDEEQARLKSLPQVTILELWRSGGRVLHALGDAHTMLNVKLAEERYLPLRFRWSGEDLLCLDEPVVNQVVISVGGVAISELYERYRSMDSYEIESYSRYNFALDLSKVKVLEMLGALPSGSTELEMVYEAGKAQQTAGFTFRTESPHGPSASDLPFVEYAFDKAAGTGLFTLRSCQFNDEYRETTARFFSEAKANQTETVIVDLRGNSGGSNRVVSEFLRHLPVEAYGSGSTRVRLGPFMRQNPQSVEQNDHLSPLFHGNLYVLTDTNSFSAATDFAVTVQDNQLGKIAGEIPGNLPSSYGDVVLFQTPRAKILFQVSYKYFTRPDLSKLTQPLYPDIEVDGEDALAAALEDAAN